MKVLEEGPAESTSAGTQPSWLSRYGLAIGLGTFCFIALCYVLTVVGPKGLIGFGPQRPVADPPNSAQFDPVVHHIYDVTNQAFQQRRIDLLAGVYDTRCQCYQQAAQAIHELLASRRVLGGNGTTLTRVRALAVRRGVALVEVTDRVDPYPITDEQGHVVMQAAGRQATSFTLTLEQQGDQWLVKDVVSQINSLP